MKRYSIILLVFLTACSEHDDSAKVINTPTAETGVARSFDFAQLRRGQQLFQKNCAECHGSEAQGTVNWRQADADGKFPPPPLNGTAHAWHHSMQVLKDTIMKGTLRLGGNMPPWEGKLTDKDVEDILAWIQSKWPDEIYNAWYQRQQKSGSR